MDGEFSLKGGAIILTHEKHDAWRVSSGRVLVYVAPWKDDAPGRRAYLCEAKAGEVIPALHFRDYAYTQWRFCLVAAEAATLSVIPGGNTSILRTRFSQRAGLRDVDTEGFEQAAVNFYKLTLVAEDGLIHKTAQERKTTAENTLKLIYNVFHKGQLTIENKNAGHPLYGAVAKLCAKTGVPLAPLSKILEACPRGFTIEDIARISHVSCREIVLGENWHRSDAGAILAFDSGGNPVALLPKGRHRYTAHSADNGTAGTVTTAQAVTFQPKAYALYRPLPNKPLGLKELYAYCLQSVNAFDIAHILLFTALCTAIGLLMPALNQLLYDTLIPLGAVGAVWQTGFVIGAAMVGGTFFAVYKSLANFRVLSRITVDFGCALQDRLFNLPMGFYRRYESVDLAQRMFGASSVVGAAVNALLITGLTAVMSIVYFVRMLDYSPTLSWAGFLMIGVYTTLLLLIARRESKYQAQIQEILGKAGSALYQYISGISKIRMAGAEDRALYEYMKLYVHAKELEGRQHAVSSLSAVLSIASTGLFSVVLYWLLLRGNGSVSVGEFIAFTSAFGLFSGAFMQVASELSRLRVLKSDYGRAKPLLAETPEYDEGKELPGDLRGELELNNITFAYEKDAPAVLDNVSLHVNPGEYIGIVGPSGCGKSTLLKILLGFEAPDTGKVYYDGKDIESLDKRELRKKLGVVLQNGKLISGSIFENITITAPKATLADAEKVVREVGLAQDIREMPMGLHTVLSEDCGTISGGQQQRILIARAIIGKPGLLFFDEATSALDNVTQAMVCESLKGMHVTRLVIAHRLSTIIHCDRIIVMEAGRIVEQGSYRELMEARGLFHHLASRQIS